MATAGGATLTNENRNYVLAVNLVTGVGTTAVREIFDQLPIFAPRVLTKNLNNNRKSPEMKSVQSFLRNILFPVENASKIWKSTEFDLTMMVALIQKLYTPLPADVVSWDARKELIKVIKENRNTLVHSKDPSISDADFKIMWNDVSQAIFDLVDPPSRPSYQQKMQDIKDIPIGNEEFLNVIQLVKDDSQKFKDDVSDLQKTQTTIDENQKVMKKMQTEMKTEVDRIQADLEKLKEVSTSKEQEKERGEYFGGYKEKYFTGREKELAKLETIFAVNEASERAFCGVSICGTGGYGKTALAAEYAHRHEDLYVGGIIWIACDNLIQFSQRINEVTLTLGLGGTSVEEKLSLVTDWLIKRNGLILLIVDNVDEEPLPKPVQTLISGSWRDKFKGHMLITTRKQASDVCCEIRLEEDCCIQLQTLQTYDAVNFLFHQSQLSQTDDLQRDAELVCKDLGNLPLALEQSGSYIKKMKFNGEGSPLSQYHQIFETRKAKLIEKLSKHGNRFKATPIADDYSPDRLAIQTTWIVNFEHIKKSSKAAAYVMLILSFFDVSDIPCCMLSANPEYLMNLELKETLEESQDMGLQENEIQDYLTQFSLFYHNKENHTLSVHPLIQFLMREEALNSKVTDIFHDGINLLGGAFNNLKVLPIDILQSKEKGVSIYNLPSIYDWGQLAHHSDVFVAHILQHQESEMYQQTERKVNLLQTFYSHSMSRVLYEVATHLCINGSNEKAIMFRNMAIRAASFWNVTLPFENLRAISNIPLTTPAIMRLKTCLLSNSKQDEIEIFKGDQDFGNLEEYEHIPIPTGEPCVIASKCRNHIQGMKKLEDIIFLLARSRCNAALACSDIHLPQSHDSGCKCSVILGKKLTRKTNDGHSIKELSYLYRPEGKRKNPDDVQIIVLKKGRYDLSKYAEPSVTNTHYIGVNKDECIFVTQGTGKIELFGTVHFENVTLNCSDRLSATPGSIVSFSNCKFQSKKKSNDFNNFTITGSHCTIFILDSQAFVKSTFLFVAKVSLTIQGTNLVGNHCGTGIRLKDGNYLNLYEVDVESFDYGLWSNFLPLGKCHIRLCKFHHQTRIGVIIERERVEGQVDIKAELPELILSKNFVMDNGFQGASIGGNFSVLIENNYISRNARLGLCFFDCKHGYGWFCENVITKNGEMGLLGLDRNTNIECVGNTVNGNLGMTGPWKEFYDSSGNLRERNRNYQPQPLFNSSLYKSIVDSLCFKGLDSNKDPKHVLRFFLKRAGFRWTALSQEEQIWMKTVSAAYCRYQLANRDAIQLPLYESYLATFIVKESMRNQVALIDNTIINGRWFMMQIITNIPLNAQKRFVEKLLYKLFPFTEKLAALSTSFKDNLNEVVLQLKDPLKESNELAQLCPNCLSFVRESHFVRCESCRVIRYCSTLCLSDHFKKHQEDCIKIQKKYIVAVDIKEDSSLRMLQSNQAVPVKCCVLVPCEDRTISRPFEVPNLEIKILSERMVSILEALSGSLMVKPSMGVILPVRLIEDGNKLLIYLTDTFCIKCTAQVMDMVFQAMTNDRLIDIKT